MPRLYWRALAAFLLVAGSSGKAAAQQVLSWEQVLERFRANNPNLVAGRISIDESRADEVTAGLRPNPELSVVLDEFHVTPPVRPLQDAQWTPYLQELIERRHKRQLRVQSARSATSIASTDQQDLERTMTFNLRDAFNRMLGAKSVLELAQDNIKYYDEVVRVNRERLKAGDIAQSDFDRIELQRVQYETDVVNAQVGLRTAKIDLVALMNDRRQEVDTLDVTGNFGFADTILLPQELHTEALAGRPDLKSAISTVDKARVDNKLAWANGSWDPTIGLEYQREQNFNTIGFGVDLPIRIFDRNQGEKARTALEIQRSDKLRENLAITILHDVDAAYATVESTRQLLRPYRDHYLPQAERVRDTVSFAYRNGGASLLDFLDAQKSYRDTQLSYRNLISSYLTAVNQLNLAIGREVMQ